MPWPCSRSCLCRSRGASSRSQQPYIIVDSPAVHGGCDMSMLVDVSRLRTGSESIIRTLDPVAFAGEQDFVVSAPVELSVEIRKDEKKARVVGRLATTITVDCSRCLDPFP